MPGTPSARLQEEGRPKPVRRFLRLRTGKASGTHALKAYVDSFGGVRFDGGRRGARIRAAFR
jgi:hypothetical protein